MPALKQPGHDDNESSLKRQQAVHSARCMVVPEWSRGLKRLALDSGGGGHHVVFPTKEVYATGPARVKGREAPGDRRGTARLEAIIKITTGINNGPQRGMRAGGEGDKERRRRRGGVGGRKQALGAGASAGRKSPKEAATLSVAPRSTDRRDAQMLSTLWSGAWRRHAGQRTQPGEA